MNYLKSLKANVRNRLASDKRILCTFSRLILKSFKSGAYESIKKADRFLNENPEVIVYTRKAIGDIKAAGQIAYEAGTLTRSFHDTHVVPFGRDLYDNRYEIAEATYAGAEKITGKQIERPAFLVQPTETVEPASEIVEIPMTTINFGAGKKTVQEVFQGASESVGPDYATMNFNRLRSEVAKYTGVAYKETAGLTREDLIDIIS